MTSKDAEDFGDFVRATGTQLHRQALLLTGDHHLAEDLTQTTYAKVYASWRRVSRADNPLAYARTTLLNAFLSHRRLRRSSEVPRDLHLDHIGPADSAPVDPATRLDLLAALTTLSGLDRAVVVLRYWEDRSVADTARDLGLTETAVRTRSRRALQRLRPLVDADLTEETAS
ncbi:SigE family RNA polymerase sigma factor [Nocardioides sp. T2.26MG-1]|uniref:SigE family RNA polymerase sigma factor n=1 Tax=Nocardioides sp. T2.26MG-1 TaxID=3041166 RepID=UPI002477C5E2|nr:SigE family RNA polymerase sigma factor [Nocardioides sp. T2.26MG-1]CAI9406328.1 RNA polymerase sigma-E factor [Nocardioides sp. T2.26MG-1]